jgi:hypothetical protein
MKVMTAHGDTAIDRAMGRFFTNPEFMKGLKKQAEEEGKSLHDIKDKWVKQLFAWMQPSGAPEPTLPPPEPCAIGGARNQNQKNTRGLPLCSACARAIGGARSQNQKTRQASRSAAPAAPVPVPSEAPAAEEEKARPSRGRPKWKPKPSRAPRTQSETAKPKPSRAPRRREESIETVPSTSVPPTAAPGTGEEGAEAEGKGTTGQNGKSTERNTASQEG